MITAGCPAGRLAATLLVTAACGGGSSTRSADLVRDVRGYGDGLRWRDFPSAALRIAPDRRGEFLDKHEHLDEDLRIVDWEMRRLEYDDTHNRAQVQIEYSWLLDSRGIVHTTVTRQFWSRHGDRWLLHREVRVRGEPMPGVADPPRGGPKTDLKGQDSGNSMNDGPDGHDGGEPPQRRR